MSEKPKSYASRKGTKDSPCYAKRRKITSKKPLNRYVLEKQGVGSVSANAKKIKPPEDINVDATFGYRILNFVTVFSAISQVVKCKACGSNVKFTECAKRGLGFKLIVACDKCPETSIPNSPLIDKTYDINRRLILAMRLLGIGIKGIEKFCAFMELPCPILRSFYDSVMQKISIAAESVAKRSMGNAVEEEKKESMEKNNTSHLTVSGDGSWRERTLSSIDGVMTLIGWFTGKVVDVIVKSKYCDECEVWKNKSDLEEYAEWKEEHHRVCEVNNDKFTGKTEDDAVVEMFRRSHTLYNVKYENYVGEGDPKNYKGIIDAKPYDDLTVILKENIDNLKKKLSAKLRNLRNSRSGENLLTAKFIDELSTHYGQVVHQHHGSAEKMRDAIWAILYHKISTDKKPQHQKCPPGEDSWCSWQKAKATSTLSGYRHKPAMPQVLFNAVKPVYEELSNEELLSRCLSGSVERSKESFNAMIWSMAPKSMTSAFNVATYVAACVCNDGIPSVMQVMQVLGMTIGQHCYGFCTEAEARRIHFSVRRCSRREDEEDGGNLDSQFYGAGLD